MKNPMPVCTEAKRKTIKHTFKEIQMKTVRIRVQNGRRIVSEKEKYPEEPPNAKQIIPNTMKIENAENGGGENFNVQSITENSFENCLSDVKETLDIADVEVTDETKKVEKLEDASDDDVNKLDIVEIDVDDSIYVDSKVSYLFGRNSIVILFWLQLLSVYYSAVEIWRFVLCIFSAFVYNLFLYIHSTKYFLKFYFDLNTWLDWIHIHKLFIFTLFDELSISSRRYLILKTGFYILG